RTVPSSACTRSVKPWTTVWELALRTPLQRNGLELLLVGIRGVFELVHRVSQVGSHVSGRVGIQLVVLLNADRLAFTIVEAFTKYKTRMLRVVQKQPTPLAVVPIPARYHESHGLLRKDHLDVEAMRLEGGADITEGDLGVAF